MRISGTWQRDSRQTGLTCDAPNVPVGPALIRRLSGVCPGLAEQVRELTGSGNLHATLDYHPGAARPWDHDVTFTLTGGNFGHKQLPVPLDGITASLRCVNGHIDRAEARAGPAPPRSTSPSMT